MVGARHERRNHGDEAMTPSTTTARTIPNIDTPWGRSDRCTELAPGIVFASTPSHGGFRLHPEMNARVPAEWRDASFNGNGRSGWYEEDCDWSLVALTFPELFSNADLVAAKRTFDGWIAKKLAA